MNIMNTTITSFVFNFFKHYLQFYGSEKEFTDHFLSGEVKVEVPDVIKMMEKWERNKPKIPSQHQINDDVIFELCPERCIMKAKVIKVHFSESKILYDLIVIATDSDGNDVETRLYNIDSLFVKTLV